MKKFPLLSPALFGICFLAAAPLQSATLIHDTFAVDSYHNQDLNNQKSAWYNSGASSTINDSNDGALKINTATGNMPGIISYFATPKSPTQLAQIGDSLSVSLKFSLEVRGTISSGGDMFRFSLFNSGGSRVYNDNHGLSNAAFTSYRGYTAYLDVTGQKTQDPIGLRLRDTDGSGLVNNGSHPNKIPERGGNRESEGAMYFASNVDYTATYTITRESNSTLKIDMKIEGGSLTGYSMTWTGITDGYADQGFDTFAIVLGNAATFNSITLKEFIITSSTIPEPSSAVVLVGLFAIATVFGIRIRQ